jgi:transcriptional regulator with AAA-type ATPase domain
LTVYTSNGKKENMDTKSVINLLKKIDIFKGVPPYLLPTIAYQFKPVSFKAKDIVIEQNQRIQNLYIIASGRLEVYIKDQRGSQSHISYLLPGEYFGDFYLLYDHPATTEIIASKDSECLCLPKENFLTLLELDPEISQHILKSILKQFRKTQIVEEAVKYKEKAIQFLQQNKRIIQYKKIIGKSLAISRLNEDIERIAKNDEYLLIEGEFGTGKELIARIIHNKSKRYEKPFISVDCEKLIPETIDNQLFGDQLFYGSSRKQYEMGLSYFELAEGGTLLLKNVEVLPLEIQVRIQEILMPASSKENQKVKFYLPNVRIMSTSRVTLQSRVEKGQFDQNLFQLLSANKICLEPLRERKKDIPDLVNHFIRKYAKYYHKKVDKVSGSAMKLLLGHDYKLSNVQELEEVIERAVTLTPSDTVRSEHLFLGLPAAKPLVLFNLLKLDLFTSWVKKKIFPEKIREIVAITFLLIIGLSLFSHQLPYPYNNIGKLLTWSIWWPAMFLSFFFIGRFWCSICPYATYSHLGKKIFCKELNFPFKKYDYLFMTIGFFFVIWVEEVSAMRHSSFKVGLLQISILSLAVIMGMVYKRDSWCRFICPLGALISTCSMASIIEVRSNPDVCLNQCTTHDCYKGTTDTIGCPMFQHLMYVDNNQTCKVCMNCVRSCTHDNISLNIRPPATEIYTSNRLNKGLSLFVIALMGILIPILLMHKHIIGNRVLPFTLIYVLTPLVLLFILWLITEMGFKSKEQAGWEFLWRLTYAYVPLALTAHIAYQLQFLPIVNNFLFSVLLSTSISENIVVYSKTLFYLFKIIYFLFEFIVFFKIITYIILTFKEIDLKESKISLLKPLLSSAIVGIILYFLPKINSYIFSLLRPTSDARDIVYSIPLFHVFQIILMLSGIILSFYCLFRILKKYKEANLKSNNILMTYHFLFMVSYSIIVLYLLIV